MTARMITTAMTAATATATQIRVLFAVRVDVALPEMGHCERRQVERLAPGHLRYAQAAGLGQPLDRAFGVPGVVLAERQVGHPVQGVHVGLVEEPCPAGCRRQVGPGELLL